MTVAVVTDSTACLPAYRIEQAKISVVPVQVIIDDRVFSEGIDVTSLAVNTALRDERDVTTSKPSVESFASLYRELAFKGATEIVSVHLSSELSGTYSSAVLAAREAELPVRVVDSRTIGLGLGFSALAAADAALAGREGSEVVEIAQRVGRALGVNGKADAAVIGVTTRVAQVKTQAHAGHLGGQPAQLGQGLANRGQGRQFALGALEHRGIAVQRDQGLQALAAFGGQSGCQARQAGGVLDGERGVDVMALRIAQLGLAAAPADIVIMADRGAHFARRRGSAAVRFPPGAGLGLAGRAA